MTVERVKVWVSAHDPISEAGVVSQLRPRPEIRLLRADEVGQSDVAVVVVDTIDDEAVQQLRAVHQHGVGRTVLVVGHLDDNHLVTVVETGVVGVLRRSEASAERLVKVITSAAVGEGSVPPDLLGRLLDQVGRLQRQVLAPRGISFNGLATREIAVLRLVAEGLDTAEIARRLSYSERTVKNVLHDVTTRLQLRNRSHAVAYAMREGLL
jgi:DNA-binding NarL/FixJ family response regulator